MVSAVFICLVKYWSIKFENKLDQICANKILDTRETASKTGNRSFPFSILSLESIVLTLDIGRSTLRHYSLIKEGIGCEK